MLEELRKKIDEIDSRIVRCLKERSDVVLEIAKTKSMNHIGIADEAREDAVIEHVTSEAKSLGVDEDTVWAVFRSLILGSRATQRRQMKMGFGRE